MRFGPEGAPSPLGVLGLSSLVTRGRVPGAEASNGHILGRQSPSNLHFVSSPSFLVGGWRARKRQASEDNPLNQSRARAAGNMPLAKSQSGEPRCSDLMFI